MITELERMKADAKECNKRMQTRNGTGYFRIGGIRPPGKTTLAAASLITDDWQSTAALSAQLTHVSRSMVLAAMSTLLGHKVADCRQTKGKGCPNHYRRGPEWAAKMKEWGVVI